MARVLMIVSAADSLTMRDGTEHPTGFWAEELVVAHRALRRAGHTVDLATPGGRRPTVDGSSLAPDATGGPERADEFRAYLQEIDAELSAPGVLADVDAHDYDAVVLPGGHGPMADLVHDPSLGRILATADRTGRLIAPFCHGPAGLLSAQDDGTFLFAGRRLTAFTNQEELTGGTGDNTPWFLETVLREKGAVVETGPAWASHVVRDANLISGQNPGSSQAVADVLLEALAD
ncbi:type 1 glutamine amidotransferase domain-containing protein [Kocuria sp. NPDC057446]|uniref:type 1 glutamine amidotransferase domain-containing protein n=1 Tax=Kocuria sp. NPDC057446 TaxID=3346137 RepID=UPI00368C7800